MLGFYAFYICVAPQVKVPFLNFHFRTKLRSNLDKVQHDVFGYSAAVLLPRAKSQPAPLHRSAQTTATTRPHLLTAAVILCPDWSCSQTPKDVALVSKATGRAVVHCCFT